MPLFSCITRSFLGVTTCLSHKELNWG